MIGVSVGTGGVLGLTHLRQIDPPTTAYLMVGDRCAFDCAFCTQACHSASQSHLLSRVTWPPYPADQVARAVAASYARKEIARCCLQVTVSPDYLLRTVQFVAQLHALSPIPICVSVVLSDLDDARLLFAAGAERVTLALDAASEPVFHAAKGGHWSDRVQFLSQVALLYPGRIGTHLIAGLGETEQEMCMALQQMVDRGIAIGLFSFTPVPGTRWGDRQPPDVVSYRRIQAARFLMEGRLCRVENLRFSSDGRIVSYGLAKAELVRLLGDGRAFETAGCAGCNRPYYNERPGQAMYNYPRPLRREEIEQALASALSALVD